MMKVLSVWCLVLGALVSFGRTISTGTIYANPGASVVVPVTIDSVSDVGAAVVTIGYDPTVVVCLGAESGEMVYAKSFTYLDSGNGRVCAICSGFNVGATGDLFRVRFSVRDGTQGLFSDVTLQDVQLGAKDGVTDLAALDSLKTVNGMLRVLATDASATRLEEHFTVWPRTVLKNLTLTSGDGITADAEGEPIRVSQCISATGTIFVSPPLGGWQTGSYALLTTPTSGLSFELEGVTNAAFRTTSEAGFVTYWADVTADSGIVIELESGSLDKATVAQIKMALADELVAHPEIKKISVKGDVSMIPVVADLGIAPKVDILGTTATATYAKPSITITEFTPDTGHVRIKVFPGEGNAIRTVLATGCIHVYGTSDLSQKMKYMAGTSFDLSPYLQNGTKGEADLTISLGTHTFIKIKAETIIKQEGDTE